MRRTVHETQPRNFFGSDLLAVYGDTGGCSSGKPSEETSATEDNIDVAMRIKDIYFDTFDGFLAYRQAVVAGEEAFKEYTESLEKPTDVYPKSWKEHQKAVQLLDDSFFLVNNSLVFKTVSIALDTGGIQVGYDNNVNERTLFMYMMGDIPKEEYVLGEYTKTLAQSTLLYEA